MLQLEVNAAATGAGTRQTPGHGDQAGIGHPAAQDHLIVIGRDLDIDPRAGQ